jgi:protein-S-isoprenylcysteine O-methyltransferase Ste14
MRSATVAFWLGFIIIGIGLWIKLKQEESVMLKHFPEYSDYRKQVKALVPFVN